MRKVIAVYQIISGLIGAFLSLGSFIEILNEFDMKPFSFFLIMFTISLFLCYCGFRLFLSDTKITFQLNFLSQLIQLVSISIGGVFLKFFFGLGIYVGLEINGGTELKIGAGLSEFKISTLVDKDYFFIGVNIVSLILLLWFWENGIKSSKND
jgi:hypothetical protein